MLFVVLHNFRFGQKFVERVANPQDMIYFHRKKDMREKSEPQEGKYLVYMIIYIWLFVVYSTLCDISYYFYVTVHAKLI